MSSLKWNDEGLIPAIVQDAENSEVLMMAWMDQWRSWTRLRPGRRISILVRGGRTGTKGRHRVIPSKSSQSGSTATVTLS